MKLTSLRLVLVALLVIVAISFLGGTAMWRVLGFGDDLSIDGRAETVREAPVQLGNGWSAYGGDEGGNRYSAAAQIDRDNIDDLETAWIHQTGAFDGREAARHRASFQTTPILVHDALILCTQFNEVIALDPGTGERKWEYDPQVPIDGRPGNEFTCRGVAHFAPPEPTDGACQARVFVGTVEAELIAVDSETGVPCREFGDAGRVQIEPSLALRWPGEFQITSAPVVFEDVVITGTSISDNLRTDAPLGTVHAFDAVTGAPLWKYNPIPWNADGDTRVGHANVWSTMSVDSERGLVFLPTSTASPDYFGGERPGNNENANSVVALNARTGEVVWAYQIVHHDVWDYDLPAQPGLYQIWHDGAARDVVVQVTKMGLIFVLDRDTGEPVIPVEERPVPQDGVDGELLSPTQPFPVRPEAVVPDRLDPGKAFGVTLWDKMACGSKLRQLRQDGLYTPPTVDGTLAYPFTGGGANWGSAAFDPSRNLLVINMNNVAQSVHLHPNTEAREATEIDHDAEFAPMEGAPYAMSRKPIFSPLGLPCSAPPWGVIAGVDVARGEIVWRRPFGTTKDLAPGGLALNLGMPSFGGPAVTGGGLIFIGASMDDYLRALDVETGKELWKGRLPAGGQATPMTYVWNGKQYVVIAAGGHGKSGTRIGDHVVAFALPD
ncbi:MAG: pyrroloquinoline quinone-dependent dehydrogenase [Hyphomonadaceae bacterium]|nr:pyrroloquinoline quinone-dependent dehydrogenase [Hyphomonadaceae bacterium]